MPWNAPNKKLIFTYEQKRKMPGSKKPDENTSKKVFTFSLEWERKVWVYSEVTLLFFFFCTLNTVIMAPSPKLSLEAITINPSAFFSESIFFFSFLVLRHLLGLFNPGIQFLVWRAKWKLQPSGLFKTQINRLCQIRWPIFEVFLLFVTSSFCNNLQLKASVWVRDSALNLKCFILKTDLRFLGHFFQK